VSSEGLHTETVLLAEDDEIVRAVVERALQREGFLVLPAADAREALAIWQQVPNIAALVTDVEMGDGPTGIELAEHVLRDKPTLPVLIVSAYLSREPIVAGENVSFLHKPFSAAKLVARLRELLLRPAGENRASAASASGC
jgi:two-component system, cell cycle sensor histidine kinase and response regulator CckA